MPTPPTIRISEFDLSYPNPSGVRHQQLTASGWVKNLGTTTDTLLDFGSVNNSNGKVHSSAKALIVNVDDMKDATEAVYDMRFWCSDDSDFATGTRYLNGFTSGVWFQDLSLTDASGLFIGTTLPSGQNLYRQDGGEEITASGSDSQSSHWIYLSVSVDTNVPPATYGGAAGGFVYRLTFDYR